MKDWRKLYRVPRSDFRLEYLVDSVPQPLLPATIDDAFATRATASPMLRFRVGRIVVVSHLFTPDEIDFDLDPRDVRSQDDLGDLLGFMRLVGDAVSNTVMLTYEGDAEHPVITFESDLRRFQYHASTR